MDLPAELGDAERRQADPRAEQPVDALLGVEPLEKSTPGRVLARAARVDVRRAVEQQMCAVAWIVEGQRRRQARGETGHRGVAQELRPLHGGSDPFAAQVDDERIALESIPGAPLDQLAEMPLPGPPGAARDVVIEVVEVLVAGRRGSRVERQLGAELHAAIAARFEPEDGSRKRPAPAAIGSQERPPALDTVEAVVQLTGGEDFAAPDAQLRLDVADEVRIDPAYLDASDASFVDVDQ